MIRRFVMNKSVTIKELEDDIVSSLASPYLQSEQVAYFKTFLLMSDPSNKKRYKHHLRLTRLAIMSLILQNARRLDQASN